MSMSPYHYESSLYLEEPTEVEANTPPVRYGDEDAQDTKPEVPRHVTHLSHRPGNAEVFMPGYQDAERLEAQQHVPQAPVSGLKQAPRFLNRERNSGSKARINWLAFILEDNALSMGRIMNWVCFGLMVHMWLKDMAVPETLSIAFYVLMSYNMGKKFVWPLGGLLPQLKGALSKGAPVVKSVALPAQGYYREALPDIHAEPTQPAPLRTELYGRHVNPFANHNPRDY